MNLKQKKNYYCFARTLQAKRGDKAVSKEGKEIERFFRFPF